MTDSWAGCWISRKRGQYIPQSEGKQAVDQLAYNPIAKGKLQGWKDLNRKPFASILYKFLLVMLCADACKAAVLQIKKTWGLDKSIGHYR